MATNWERARILLHRAADQSYQEIATQVGVSKSEVAAVVNEIEEEAAATSAERVVLRELGRGGVELVGFEMVEDFVDTLLGLMNR